MPSWIIILAIVVWFGVGFCLGIIWENKRWIKWVKNNHYMVPDE